MGALTPSSGLLCAAVGGDRESLARLMRENEPWLRSQMNGALPKRWQSLLDIDDVLQETFTDAFLGIAEFTPRGIVAFRRWLLTMSENNLRTAIRSLEAGKRGGFRRSDGPSEGSDEAFITLYQSVSGSAATPSGLVARLEARQIIERAIERLPAVYRFLVRGFDIQGRSPLELALELGRSVGAVYMLRARAHRLMRKILEDSSKNFSDFA